MAQPVVATLDTIHDLIGFDPVSTYYEVHTKGYWAVGDGGGGIYRWNNGSTKKPNGGTVIETTATGLTGVWELQHLGVVSVRQFGAVGDGHLHQVTEQIGLGKRWLYWDTTSDTRSVKYYFQNWCSDTSGLGQLKGTWFELMANPWLTQGTAVEKDWFTLDGLAINMAILAGLKDGFKVVAPRGKYLTCLPIWIGYDEHSDEWDTTNLVRVQVVNWWMKAGFTFEGESGNARSQGDGDVATSITLVVPSGADHDFTNRFTLRLAKPAAAGSVGLNDKFKLQPMWNEYGRTAQIAATASTSTLQSAINSALPSDSTGTPSTVWGTGNLDANNTWIVQLVKDVGLAANATREVRSWHGEFQVQEYTTSGTNWGQSSNLIAYTRIYADCAIVSFRGTAQRYCRISNFTLTAYRQSQVPVSDPPPARTEYLASFGLCFPHTNLTGFEVENVSVTGCRWGFGILENNAANGENTRFQNCKVEECFGFFYSNGGQAFDSLFLNCVGTLDGLGEDKYNSIAKTDAEEETRYAFELAQSALPGHVLQLVNSGFTLRNNVSFSKPNARNVLLKMHGSGGKVGQFVMTGSRSEHIDTLVEWDGTMASDTMKVRVNDVYFDGMRGSPTRPFISDLGAAANTTSGQFVATFEQCHFDAYFVVADGLETQTEVFVIQGHPLAQGHVEISRCRFNGWCGRNVAHQNYSFDSCLWRQPNAKSFRRFSDSHASNTAAGSWGDLPRTVPSGPTQNRLQWSAEPFDDVSGFTIRSPWALSGGGAVDGFQKLGRTYNSALGLTEGDRESFGIKLAQGRVLSQQTGSRSGASPVLTYEAFVKAAAGSFVLSLEDTAGTGIVYDSVSVTTSVWRHVCMTATGPDSGFAHMPYLKITSLADNSILFVKWQAALHGDGPFASMYTENSYAPGGSVPGGATDDGTWVDLITDDDINQHWTHVAHDLRVPGRLQIPYRKDLAGYRASPALPDLRTGEIYLDAINGALMVYRAGDWIVTGETPRWTDIGSTYEWDVTDGTSNRRFLVFPTGSASTVNLKTEEVPNGMRVTVFNRSTSGTITVNTKTGTTATPLVLIGHGSTVTFVNRKTTSGVNGWYLESKY